MTVTAYDIVINAQDKASAIYEKLQAAAKRFKTDHVNAFESVNEATKNLEAALKKNEFAFDSWGENVESSFRDMGRVAGATASEVNLALQSLGQRSLASLRQEIKAVGSAFIVLKNSGTLSAGELAAAHGKVKAKISELTAEYSRLRSGSTQALTAIKQGTSTATTGTAGLALGLGSVQAMLIGIASGVTARGFLSVNAGMQSMQRSLDTITKGKGVETFKALNDWARVMPINTEAAIQGFIRMKSMGLEPTLADMTILVDTTQALGGSVEIFNSITRALGQMATKGKVSTEEVLQLAEAGVPVYRYLQQELGLTKAQLANLGNQGIESGKAIKAVLDGMKSDFGGLSQSATGDLRNLGEEMLSWLKDFAFQIGSNGVTKYIQTELQKLSKYLSSVAGQDAMADWARRIADALISLAESAKTVVSAVAPLAKTAASLATEFPTATVAVLALRTGLGSFGNVFDLFKKGAEKGASALSSLWQVSEAVKEVGLGTAVSNVTAVLKGDFAAGATAVAAKLDLIGSGLEAVGLAATPMGAALVAAAAVSVVQIYKLYDAIQELKRIGEEADQAIAEGQKLVAKNATATAAALQKVNEKYGTTFRLAQSGKIILDDATRARMAEMGAVKQVSKHLTELATTYTASTQEMGSYFDYMKERTVAIAQTEKERADAAIEAERRRAAYVIQSAEESAAAQLRELAALQVAEQDSADKVVHIHKGLATAKIEALKTFGEAIKKSISDSIALEKQYSDEAKRYREDAANRAIKAEQTVLDLMRQGMNDQQKINSLRKELSSIQSEINALMAEGSEKSLKQILQLSERGTSLATTLAGMSKQTQAAGIAAFKQIDAAAGESEKKLGKLAEDRAKAEEEFQKTQLKTLGNLNTSIEALNSYFEQLTAQQTDKTISIVADEQALAEFNRLVDEITKPATKTVEIVTKQKSSGSSTTAEAVPVEGYATGGLVGEYFRRLVRRYVSRGSGLRDDVPALLTRGEFVLNRNAVRYYGRNFVEQLNAMVVPAKYHVGGMVDRAMGPMMAAASSAAPALAPAFAGLATPSDMGSLNILAGDRSVRVTGRADDLKWLKQAVGRENLRRKSGA